jgi:hypothetical protein
MGKCKLSDGGISCGRESVAMSPFCSIHTERGKPESVITPDPSGWGEGGKRRGNEWTNLEVLPGINDDDEKI